ncbi:uncharacterized protein LOC121560736 isoform X1 [Coregonus clupeaformis]|uniref:uncharacterized protein LOC121560736 isoform X1 n=1 Tax=Coregonus clupeaformis TaxID=59861 RepID=UPI001E1C4848|nr:uncharacterized protein LOC121560736 isoform X1 [Coregonus clupeaformis]XP_041729587.2 uncharacterized protein LOC121560736 isoform X1 [Coregonus clupeaformis]XP_045072406.1 uncharacterized protein LOC121560736 isoform X1 [Coregonus clupeaformis]
MDLHLTGFWLLLIPHTVLVFCDMEFLERPQGDSVEFHCISEFNATKPIGLYLKRKWLQPNREVLFMYTAQKPALYPDVKQRIHVTGDPSTHRVNVTLSQLKGTDTDLYYCEFVFPDTSVDQNIPSKMELFLYVNDAEDAPDNKMDVGLIETCAGGSAVLPCLAPHGSPSAMEGVCLKRRWNRDPVEVLFHSKRPSSASFPPEERLHLATGLGGLAYNLTLLEMQPEESAFYSCELLLPGRPDNSARLGRHVYFVSVQGVRCSCTGYVPLLYGLSAAVGLLLIFLMALGVAHYGKTQGDRVKLQPHQASIYEEMVGVRPPNGMEKWPPLTT